MTELEQVLRELAELDARLGVENTDWTINKRGAEPVAEDHNINAHDYKDELAEKRNASVELHEQRQALVERIDSLRLEAADK